MRNIPPRLLVVFCSLLFSISGLLAAKSVILSSIEIFSTHEWLSPQPVIYFQCQGENKIILPDVKEKSFVYKFKGIESWQPLAELPDKKCKRCGFYELDRLKSDDVFDEWELCPDEFLERNYVHYKQKEVNATFTCTECMTTSRTDKESHLALAVLIGTLTSFMAAAGTFGIYKYWQKRKREQNQAKFLKLFDEGDDIDDELDL